MFADTQFWVALANPRDSWNRAALEAKSAIGEARIATTDEVMVEFLNSMSAFGPGVRTAAVRMAREVLANPNIDVVSQNRVSFLDGLALYEKRRDKSYSLTDCISMETMRKRDITEILTNDHHFEQEGFVCLIRT